MAETILIVDDTPVNVKLLASILRKDGLAFITATDGAEGLERARREHPDLILLDIMMPGKDGYAVCRELKQDPATADISVIFLSALGEAQDKVKGLTLGAADYVTKPFDAAEVLARVRTQLRLRRLTVELLEKQRAIEEDLRAAADVQRALIPRSRTGIPGLSLAWLFEPCAAVGGDMFNVVRLDDEHVALYILDVSGHGVPPAMVAVCVSQSLSPTGGLVATRLDGSPDLSITDPSEVLAELDREYPLARFDRYFTISYLVLHLPTGRLRHSSAGHPPPLFLGRDGSRRLLEAGGTIVGLGGERFEAAEVRLQRGDRVFLYTDGVLETEAPGGARFGSERLAAVLASSRSLRLEEACAGVKAALEEFSGSAPPRDDISFLAVEYCGPGKT
jgi:phosphoserine phosphatase RsbU/P